MAVIREYLNPFTPGEPAVEHQHAGGITVWEWLQIRTPGFISFTVPTVCSVVVRGGAGLNYLLPADWKTYVIHPDDVITFTAIPGDAVTFFIAILVVLVVAAVVLILTMPKPLLPGQQKIPNSIYNLEGRQNENKYGQPIPDNYGRNRLYPAYGAGAYNEFDVDGNQILYVVMCIGHGEYEIETEEVAGDEVPSYRFGDTNIVNFEGIEVQNCPPGTPVTLFPNNVITITGVQGLELFGPNETGDYVENVHTFATSTTLSTRVGIDIVFPSGLYASDAQGNFVSNTIQGTWEYSTDGGSTWVLLFNFSRTLATNNPQRFTVNTTIPLGVTHIRANRTNDRDLNARSGNTLTWQAMRMFLPSTVDYGNVHMVAFKALATNNLNTQSQATFNFICTRKLPIYNLDLKTWSAPTATRSLVWAFCAVAKASYGGRRTDDGLDLEGLVALDEVDAALGNTFDGQFAQKTGLWDGPFKTIAAAWRGRPMMVGRKLTIIRDVPRTLPETFFNTSTIVKDSADLAIETPEDEPIDGIEITYVDEDTLKEETVMCYYPDEPYPTNPDKITMTGISVRRQAYQEGMIQYGRKRLQRINLTIKTGLEGQLASYGAMVGVCRDKPRWGAGGRVQSIVYGSPSVITLNEPCRFGTNAIAIGTVTVSGNLAVTIYMDGGSVALSVAVEEGDTAVMWASRVRKALLAEADVSDLYEVFGTGDRISLRPKPGTPYYSGLNLALINDTCAGITNADESNSSHVITFKAYNGDMMGPFYVSPGVDDFHLTTTELTDDDNSATGIDNIPLDDIHERAPFAFGLNDFWLKKMIVVGMTPSGKEEVELQLVNYAPGIFAADDIEAYPVPALPDASEVPLNPALPAVSGVLVAGVPSQVTRALVSWRAALGARYYVVQTQIVADIGAVLSADAASDVLTKTAHGFVTGDLILVSFEDPDQFGGLTTLNSYYCIFLTVNTFKLAKTEAQARAGTAINLTSDGSSGTALRITDGWVASTSVNGLSSPLTVSPSFLIARVAGVNTGQGRWSYWQGQVGVAASVPGTVSGLRLANAISTAFSTTFDSYEALIQWVPATGGSVDVSVKVYQTDGMLLLSTHNLGGNFFNYTVAQAELDVSTIGGGAVMKRELTFEVYAVNSAGVSTEYASLAVENAEPSAVTGMASLLIKEEPTQNTYRITWMQARATDIKEYKIYGGDTSGALTLLDTGLFVGFDFVIPLTAGAHPAQYWQVGVVDRWDYEITLAAEQTIASYP